MKQYDYRIGCPPTITEVADVPPTAEEVRLHNLAEIETLKRKLAESDYKAIKYAEGWLPPQEYAQIKDERQTLRERINELEAQLYAPPTD